MDIFAYAMKMEKDGENFYRDVAETTDDGNFRFIMIMLAEDEAQHYNAIAAMRMADDYEIEDSHLIMQAKNIFASLDPTKIFTPEKEQIELYRSAREIEKMMMDFYNEKAAEADDPRHAELFKKLAAEERKHYFLMDNIVELMRRPKQWLESAEWYHLDEY